MCKNWENGAKWPNFEKGRTGHDPRAIDCAIACGQSSLARLHAAPNFGTGQSRAGLGRGPGPYQTLLCS